MAKVHEEIFRNLSTFNLAHLLIPVFIVLAMVGLYILSAYLLAFKDSDENMRLAADFRPSNSEHSRGEISPDSLAESFIKKLREFLRAYRLHSRFYFILYAAMSLYLGFKCYESIFPLSLIGSTLSTYYFYIPFTVSLTVLSLFMISFSISTALAWLEFAVFLVGPAVLSYICCKEYIDSWFGPFVLFVAFILLLLIMVKLFENKIDYLGKSLKNPMNALYSRFVPIVAKVAIAILLFMVPMLILATSILRLDSSSFIELITQVVYIFWSFELLKCVCSVIINLETIDHLLNSGSSVPLPQKRSKMFYSAIFIDLCHISFLNSFIFLFSSLLGRLVLEFTGIRNLGFLSAILQSACECFMGIASIFAGAYATRSFGFDSRRLISYICYCRTFDLDEHTEEIGHLRSDPEVSSYSTDHETVPSAPRVSVSLLRYSALSNKVSPNGSYYYPYVNQYPMEQTSIQYPVVQAPIQYSTTPLSKYCTILVWALTLCFFFILSSVTYYLFLNYIPLAPLGTILNPSIIRLVLERHGFEYFILLACTFLFYVGISNISSILNTYQFHYLHQSNTPRSRYLMPNTQFLGAEPRE